MKFIDIGVNLTDPMFTGVYHDKKAHEDDFKSVLERSKRANVNKIIITGTTLSDSREAIQLARKFNQLNDDNFPKLFCTVGVHPTRCNEFEEQGADQYLSDLLDLVLDGRKDGTVVAIGECGLDYDRLKFCDQETQKKYFIKQFELAKQSQLPMFLHNRNTGGDFAKILKENCDMFLNAVVHSFDGPEQELEDILSIGPHVFIGINGCSLKTNENLNVIKKIPIDRLMIETDAPWCDIRPSHAGYAHIKTKFADAKKKERFEMGKMVKGRNEPACINQVLEVISATINQEQESLADTIYENTDKVFFQQ
ncbi:deoxyribonuclease TATDN1 [Acrasis kona]|uniref:Deoxyribonuclease TATDN1 n=1 Tax=Acrasis kona TaxID=1008807 RepID=A0AAW2ZN33_9EUKA